MRTALFTGAGASAAIGYSLTSDLLPTVRAELRDGTLFHGLVTRDAEEQDRQELRAFLRGLYAGFEQVDDRDLPLITDVFSLVEYSLASGEALSVGGRDALGRFRDLLKQAITDIILGEYREPWTDDDREPGGQQDVLRRLVTWIEDQRDGFGMVTTNYDIGIEGELYKARPKKADVYAKIDLGCDWRHIGKGDERTRPSGDDKLRIFKLHGSVDQLRCVSCGYVYFNPWGSIAHHAFNPELNDHNTCHCRDDIRLDLHIVAPSLVRDIRDANLLSVWRSALEWMRTAERWIIVGYSLPPEDLAVRSLLMRAYSTAPVKPEITVVQVGDAARPRYEVVFPGCRYVSDGLKGFLEGE